MTTTQTEDWWERLYADDASPPQTRPVTKARTRLPDWWEAARFIVMDDDTQEEPDAKDDDQEDAKGGPEPDDAPEPAGDAKPKNAWLIPQAGYWPQPTLPSLPARPALSDGTKWLLYNAAAAGAGWYMGIGPAIGGWIESCGRETSIGGALALGGGICLGIAAMWDSRTRHWYRPLAWLARIPLASALAALALYAPASQI